MVLFRVLFCIFFNLFVCCEAITIRIPDGNNSLDSYLCGEADLVVRSNTTFVLADSVVHVNAVRGLCVIENVSNITITSENPESLAVVECVGNITEGTGFAFVNVSNILISNVLFDGCGAAFLNNTLLLSDSSKDWVQFVPLNSVTLMFANCKNLCVCNTVITNYLGFGMILKNVLGRTEMNFVNITDAIDSDCEGDCNSTGSGLLIIYNHSLSKDISVYYLKNISISNGYTSEFNDDFVDGIDAIDVELPVVKFAAGLSIIISELHDHTPVNVYLNNLSIDNNRGGGIILVYVNIVKSSITIDTAKISSCLPAGMNSQEKIGESLTVYFVLTKFNFGLVNSLLLKDVNFKTSLMDTCRFQYDDDISGNAEKVFNLTSVLIRAIGDYVGQRVTISCDHKVTLNNVQFSQDYPGISDSDFGIGMYVFSFGSIIMTLHSITSFNFSCSDVGYNPNNSYYSCDEVGSLAFKKMKGLTIENGLFTEHRGCSVLYVQNTNVMFTGNIIISHNQGVIYGAIQLVRFSQLFFVEPLTLIMEDNEALYGGALYVYHEYTDNCSIQFSPTYLLSDNKMDVTLLHKNNKAILSGDTIFGYPLHHCGHTLSGSLFKLLLSKMQPQQNRTTQVSSPASLVCLCDNDKIPDLPCLQKQTSNFSVYPGQKIIMNMVAADGASSVYGTVTARIRSVPNNVRVYMKQQDVSSSLDAGSCSQVDYIIYHNVTTTQEEIVLELAASLKVSRVSVDLTLLKCPNGFTLSTDDTCECLDIYKNFGCINGTIQRFDEYWVGYTSNKRYGYSYVCPSGFCDDSLASTSINTNLDVPSPMCNGGRTGTLCTLCPKGKSVVFGSVDCQQCSHWYITTILFYCVCGILLVAMIFILQLTIRVGTINGLIFYANLLSTGFTLGYLLQVNSKLYLLRIFVSFINLNLGFPLCFYDGMNEEVNRLLQFVFPVYVWIIIGTMIIASKHSVKLSKWTGKHSVAVLATLIQLSYSKIMTNITESFPYAPIVTTDGNFNVWFFAGVDYASSSLHVFHMFISITFLLLFIVPYTLMITFAPFLAGYRVVSRYMPFLDVVYAPYKEKWRCWFGVRLCLLVFLLICRASLRGYSFKINLGVQLVSVIGFVFLQVHFKPFKNLFIHLLDVFFMLNFCACAFFSISFEDGETLFDIIAFLVSTAFLAFLGIITYHIYLVFFMKKVLSMHYMKKVFESGKMKNVLSSSWKDSSSQSFASVNSECSHGTFDRLREPILDYVDDSISSNSY